MNDFKAFRQTLTTVLRWWWLMFLAAIIGVAMGYLVSQRQPRVYQASTTLIVGQSIQATELESKDILVSQQLAQTYVDIARRQPVLQATVETLGLDDSWKELKGRVFVKLIEGTQLFEIRVEARSAEEAKLTADELSRQLILNSPTANLQNQEHDESKLFVSRQLGYLQKKIEAGQSRVTELQVKITDSLLLAQRLPASAATPFTTQVQTLQDEVDTLERLTADWQANYAQLAIFVADKKSSNYLTVIEPAQLDPNAIRPSVVLDTLLAGVVGFVLALGGIILRERLNDAPKTAHDLDHLLGLTYLGGVGRMKRSRHPYSLITFEEPFSPASEAYRMIRINLRSKSANRPLKSILVTSPAPGEGKSITAANLGVVMAQTGMKTILVDTNLRRPMLHEIFQVPNEKGLADLLSSPEVDISCYLKDTHVENLKVLTCGDSLPTNPSELLSSQRMRQLLARLSKMADISLLDSPPALAMADAAILSTQVDGVVLVIEAGRTDRDLAKQALFSLQQVGAKMLGGVLNGVSDIRNGYHYSVPIAINGKVESAYTTRHTVP